MRASSVAWNAAGLLAPLAVALAAIPPLLATLGPQRFGLLSLAWALTAISGLFDLGLGRAATRLIASQLGRRDFQQPRATLQAAVRISAAAGAGGALLLALAAALGAHRWLRFDAALDTEVAQALALLALAVPLQTLTATYRGLSEAYLRFRGISLLRMVLGVANFAAPLAVAQFTTNLAALVVSLLAARLLACLAFRTLALSALPPADGAHVLDPADRQQLLHGGGWYTVSAVVSPLLVQADRFFIGAVISAAAVATYTVPFDMITQLLVGVTAVSTVMFPSLAQQLQGDAVLARQRFRRWLLAVVVVMAVLCAVVALLLPQALAWWLGNALPREAVSVGRWLCLGVWINSVGAMYFSWLHAHARFRETALMHLLELPLYFGALFWLLQQFGVVGAALAWTARVTLDTLLLWWLATARHGGGLGRA